MFVLRRLDAVLEPIQKLVLETKEMLEEGGIEAFLKREVLPYTPDAWIDASATKVGCEISSPATFTNRSHCARSTKSGPTSWRWRRKPRACSARSSERIDDR